MLQTTPLAVTLNPPSLVIFPPLVAVAAVMEVTDAVVVVGAAKLADPPVKFVQSLPLYT